ncbi:hypothetical protein [Microbulbifer litoralis]|uniref:hypothetical protein n=1 Tax=Microbulbifer litoralis TaxID=2933965 RepID=UPI002029609B|nr:hypothetical protein [Microbulbifer sp. GX H0434]
MLVYYDSCEEKLKELENSFNEIGVNFSYKIIEPTNYAANSEFFNKMIRINVESKHEIIEATVNNFLLSCGPNGAIEVIKDNIFSKEEVEKLIKRFGVEDNEAVDLRYLDGRLFIIYSEALPSG